MGARILAYHFGLFVLNSSLLTNIQFSSLFKVFGRLTTIYCESHKIPEILIQISLCKGQSELDQSDQYISVSINVDPNLSWRSTLLQLLRYAQTQHCDFSLEIQAQSLTPILLHICLNFSSSSKSVFSRSIAIFINEQKIKCNSTKEKNRNESRIRSDRLLRVKANRMLRIIDDLSKIL